MRRVCVVLLMVIAGIAAGVSIGVNLPVASAAPSQPALMVSVNSTDVYRFVDSSGEFSAACYFVRSNSGGEHAISCVRAKP